MQGFQLTFFTLQDRRHGNQPVGDWLLDLAREQGLHGATVVAAAKGFGHDGKIHSADMLDLADQPQMVVMTATAEQVKTILARLQTEKLQLFYVKSAVEFAVLGDTGS
jgi:PII-like signaling protein